jgi:plasmid stabilization system protein ParE
VPRTLEFLDEAIEEAEAAARWYAERSPTAAAAFADEIETAIAEITRLPLAWPTYSHNTRRFLLRRFPYSVVYRVSESTTVVVAVAHGHRRPGYWRDRMG